MIGSRNTIIMHRDRTDLLFTLLVGLRKHTPRTANLKWLSNSLSELRRRTDVSAGKRCYGPFYLLGIPVVVRQVIPILP